MDFSRLLDSAMDSIEKTVVHQVVNASSLVADEFPDRSKVQNPDGAKVVTKGGESLKPQQHVVAAAPQPPPDLNLIGNSHSCVGYQVPAKHGKLA